MVDATPGTPTPAPSSAVTPPIRVGILGSCVSRDTLETMPRSAYPITTYVSRQSLLTAGSDASQNLPQDFTTSSKFQLRNVMRDVQGRQLSSLVEAGEPDVILWDLVDERHGVYEFPDGSILTRSVDVLGIPELQPALERARHIPFGGDEHFLRWSGAASSFVDAVDALGWRDRLVVLRVAWATHDAQGKATPWSMGTSADEANASFARYYRRLEQLRLPFITVDDPVADEEHRWGFAPFHYSPTVYHRIHEAVDAFVRQRRA